MSERLNRINRIKNEYGIARYNTNEREYLEKQLQEVLKNINNLSLAKAMNERITKDSEESMNEYKKKHLDIVEKNTQRNLREVFKSRDFNVKFEPDTERGAETLELLVGENGRLSPTEMQNGRGLRQVMNISIISSIQLIEGCRIFIFDEATNSSDPETIQQVSLIIQYLVSLGYQLIVVEHQHNLYNQLPRRQFNLKLNSNKAVEVEVKDYE